MEYKNLFSCENRTAIVTGGSGLIGREIVKGLAQYGAQVYIADQNEDAARALFSDNIKFIYLDITDEQSVCGALQQIAMENDKIDILVNCAYPRTKDWGAKFENVKFESWKQNVDDHLGGYFLMCKEAARNMKEHGGGSIINMASVCGSLKGLLGVYNEKIVPGGISGLIQER